MRGHSLVRFYKSYFRISIGHAEVYMYPGTSFFFIHDVK